MKRSVVNAGKRGRTGPRARPKARCFVRWWLSYCEKILTTN